MRKDRKEIRLTPDVATDFGATIINGAVKTMTAKKTGNVALSVASEPFSTALPACKSLISKDEPCRTRTYDPMIKSHLLYQLS